jgi:hypothetical protein
MSGAITSTPPSRRGQGQLWFSQLLWLASNHFCRRWYKNAIIICCVATPFLYQTPYSYKLSTHVSCDTETRPASVVASFTRQKKNYKARLKWGAPVSQLNKRCWRKTENTIWLSLENNRQEKEFWIKDPGYILTSTPSLCTLCYRNIVKEAVIVHPSFFPDAFKGLHRSFSFFISAGAIVCGLTLRHSTSRRSRWQYASLAHLIHGIYGVFPIHISTLCRYQYAEV